MFRYAPPANPADAYGKYDRLSYEVLFALVHCRTLDSVVELVSPLAALLDADLFVISARFDA